MITGKSAFDDVEENAYSPTASAQAWSMSSIHSQEKGL
jgi:hypothetical protein